MRSVSNTVHITAKKSSKQDSLRELWVYRELFYFFAWRDIKVRYKQTFLGVGWAVLQPAITAAIFTLFFNRVAKIDTGSVNVPYPVFAYLGLTYWGAFSSATSNVSNSILNNSGVINKVYFPRLIPPLSSIALAVVDFLFAMSVFILLTFIFGVKITAIGLLFILPALILIMVAALSIGLIFAALNVKYKDAKSALPFIIQAMFFMTPVIYPVTMIPERFQMLAYLNPAAGPLTAVKSLLFDEAVNWEGLLISAVVAFVLLAIGIFAFKKTERLFPDYL